MNFVYEQFDTASRNYRGIAFDEPECRAHSTGAAKDNLGDLEFWEKLLGCF